jgi:transcriptional regulator of heat shock response
MYSVNAFRYFTNYLADIKQKHKKDTNKRQKEKGSETLTVHDEVVEGITKSAQLLSEALKHTKIEDGVQSKTLKIFHSWAELSPYYLWSVPWFHEALKEFSSDAVDVQRVTKQFGMISSSKSVQRLIKETVSKVEQQLRLPDNMQI